MVSTFINNSIDGECRSLTAKKSRPRKSPLENKTISNKESESERKEKKKNPLVPKKKQTKVESKVKNTKSKEKNMKKKISKIKTNSELSSAAPSNENKTVKKSTFFEPTSASTPKVSVKEVIPAKRTRFLSIDGSLLRYGTEAKKSYSQMKSFQDKLDLDEFSPKRKVPSQKNSKKSLIHH